MVKVSCNHLLGLILLDLNPFCLRLAHSVWGIFIYFNVSLELHNCLIKLFLSCFFANDR